MKSLVEWFADNSVAANLLMFFFVVAGLLATKNSKLEVFPEITMDTIIVSVAYSGASPAEVEEGILKPVEEAVAGLAGVRKISSVATEGAGVVNLEVVQGWDVQELLDRVKNEVDRIRTFPDDAETPIVRQAVRRTSVIDVVVYGQTSETNLKRVAETLKDDITSLPDVTNADLEGVHDEEIHILIGEQTLRRYGLTLGQVAEKISAHSLDLPAGRVKTAGGEILVRAKGRRYQAADYASIPILTRPDGSQVTLGQMAQLRDTFEDTDLVALHNGLPAVQVRVYRVADQNALDVASEVKTYLEKIRPTLPEGIKLEVASDRSEVLMSRIDLLMRNMAMGLVLVMLMLGLFLSAKLALWVTLGIPISFLAALWALPWFDVSLNMISLFAFIMVLGIVVDDAIVVGESVFSEREMGVAALPAAQKGTVTIAGPVIFSLLTTVAAFLPLLMGSGTMGKIMRVIPIVVILALLASTVECMLILPAHLAHTRMRKDPDGRLRANPVTRWFSNGLFWFINGPFHQLLSACLRWRYLTLASGVAILLITVGLALGGWIKFTFFPAIDGDSITAALKMPPGTPVEQTLDTALVLEKAAEKMLAEEDAKHPGQPPMMLSSYTIAGSTRGSRHTDANSGSHLASVMVRLVEGEQRNISAKELAAKWRQAVGALPGVDEVTFSGQMFTAGEPIEFHLSSSDENALLQAVEELKTILGRQTGVADVGDSFDPGKDEVQLKLKPMARTLGITLQSLAQQVRYAFYGAEALRLQRDKNEVTVRVRYPEGERKSLSDLERMRIRTSAGLEVPFSQVAQVTMAQGYTSIQRTQRRRVVKVYADVDEGMANASEIRAWVSANVMPELTAKYPSLRWSMEGEGREESESIADIEEGFLLALFMIYSLLAVPFKSFTQPFIVMAAIPFGIVGAILGHVIMGMNATMLSLFGIVGLSGVVVNDSLILIHTANQLRREEGDNAFGAVLRAGCGRFRPIILTSVTTFAGLIPIITETSIQARMLIPMAISLGFGVLFATFITLLLIPSMYLILDDLHRLWDRLRGRHEDETSPVQPLGADSPPSLL